MKRCTLSILLLSFVLTIWSQEPIVANFDCPSEPLMLDEDQDGVFNESSVEDTDGDGLPNSRDNDDDGDGILTKDELALDVDGKPKDTDNDGLPDYLEHNEVDTDDDGDPNYDDNDDDNDGTPTLDELQGIDQSHLDDDGSIIFPLKDVDGDGLDYLDSNEDFKGEENCEDGKDDDGDGFVDCQDPDCLVQKLSLRQDESESRSGTEECPDIITLTEDIITIILENSSLFEGIPLSSDDVILFAKIDSKLNLSLEDKKCLLTNKSLLFYIDEFITENCKEEISLNNLSELCECNAINLNSDLVTYDSDDFFMEEEPKWGQLGTCDDIVNEINSLNLGGLRLSEQLDVIQAHFDCSIVYTRSELDKCLTYHTNTASAKFCHTKRYTYTYKYGWIDWHHVFKIFYWAVEHFEGAPEASGLGDFHGAAVNAGIKGYGGEVIQWIKSNNSAFSYEDLCSNQLGVALFLNSYSDLSSSTKSWNEVIQELCTEIQGTIPENAPNYEFIPHIIDGNYPKVYSSRNCLTGENLNKAAKENFCRRDIKTQLNILQAHAEFPH